MKKRPDWKQKLLTLGILTAAVLSMWLLRLPCIWKALLHIPCPGCGMTRAWVSLLELDFAAAFRYHPMFWSVPLVVILWLLDGKLFRRRFWNIGLCVVIFAGFMIHWLLSLLLL